MVADVRKADFVVVNPDHIAVALRYDRETQAAPVVVAKGERLLAEQIKQVAREAGVPIFRDVSLARALRDVQDGDEIPEALFEAVAEIVRTVRALDQPFSPPSGGGSREPGDRAAGTPGADVSRPDAGFTWKRA
jgi:flagellar biosynthetic protein FlhB